MQLGDLAARHGLLSGLNSLVTTYSDWNLPLYGPHSVLGRALALWRPDGSIGACATLGYADGAQVSSLTALFATPLSGVVSMQQRVDTPGYETTLFAGVNTLGLPLPSSAWQISRGTVVTDPNTAGRCMAAVMVVDSLGARLALGPRYSQACSPSAPQYCADGDLTGQFGALNLNASNIFSTLILPWQA